MKRLLTVFTLILFCGCGQPEPRKPVQIKSGSFFKASIERSKKLLAEEEALFKSYIKKDTIHEYFMSDTGFWYRYEAKNETSDYELKTNDEILLAYTITNFNGDIIYSKNDIGIVQHAIDKSQLFPGLRNAVKLLKEGEKATFLFPSSQAYGYKGDNNKIGPQTPIIASLELLEILKKRDNLN
ncbi:gliding motility-associated peptidyl-prolyl isomerase GldI [Croceitalea rosinachiae]|uniref:Peptidyl-prolyl cis-trans isomerase n=1 Tax=Croceitalea rosinachiae TaxID=3075596 RepID=A0ABU3ACZ9_9FLAO|nr:gliding motility-associated peptidyl-prolyl isomerase GldI [Croceitalea sp. F388]MDT0606988.1 gliding motility-associated peptidyl-prolyl isomerase GldI [Croceitalea sp. F388]